MIIKNNSNPINRIQQGISPYEHKCLAFTKAFTSSFNKTYSLGDGRLLIMGFLLQNV